MLEESGLSTVGLSLVRGQTERLHPPRALYCEFPLGRPLGKPGDLEFQRRVVDAALKLLQRPSGPVLEDFPEKIEDETDQPLACAIPPRYDPSLPPAVDEALALRPAYRRQFGRSGRTTMGRVITAAAIGDAVAAFVRIAGGTAWQEAGLPGAPTDTALDIRSFYEEAAVALSDHVPGARAASSWFYRQTITGKILTEARSRMMADGVDRDIWNHISPLSEN